LLNDAWRHSKESRLGQNDKESLFSASCATEIPRGAYLRAGAYPATTASVEQVTNYRKPEWRSRPARSGEKRQQQSEPNTLQFSSWFLL
jgi:hypothetical protein